jgi:hypothetical protein
MIVRGVPYSLVLLIRLLRTLELNTPGFFVFKEKKMEYKGIDYTKLNKRIVEQAYVLSAEAKQKLIEEKLNRAAAFHASLNKSVYHQIED